MTPILLLAEARGESEAKHSSTLIGASGIELLRMMAEAEMIRLSPVDRGLIDLYYRTNDSKHLMALWDQHPEVYRTNVFNIHPPNNDLGHFLGAKKDGIPGYPNMVIPKGKHIKPAGNFVRAEFTGELERLGDELLAHNPNVVVCLGNCALWALTGKTGITNIRGTTLSSILTVDGFKLLPTFHPSAVLRNYDLRPTVIADLMKAKRESAYAEIRRPKREIWIEPGLGDIRRFIHDHVIGCRHLSVDIETAGSRITCIGFAPTSSLGIVVPFDDERAKGNSYWSTIADERACWSLVRDVLEDPSIPKLFQNGAYDIAFLWRSIRIKVMNAVEDTMLLHHALQPESLKSLGYLGSIYSDEGSWKHMRKKYTTKRDD
jgi:uracil-DNA glycosylase